MKARRILIAALWLNLLAATATARTTIVRPDPCPAPADAPRIINLDDVEAIDLNPDRAAAPQGVLIVYPAQAKGWASARILARFDLDLRDPRPVPLACYRGPFRRSVPRQPHGQ
jgi:hypothetical protein